MKRKKIVWLILTACILFSTIFCMGVSGFAATDVNNIISEEVNVTENTEDENICTVTAPVNLTAYNYNNKLVFKWDKVEGARKYKVYRKSESDKKWVEVTETKRTSYSDTSVKNGVEYSYSVKAAGENGIFSDFARSVKCKALKKPSQLDASADKTGVVISWNKITTATGYKVYRKTPEATKWSCIKTVKDNKTTEYTDKKVESGKTYSYMVRQVNGSTLGSYDIDGVSILFLTAPEKLTVSNYNNKLIFKWKSVPGAVKYRVYRKLPSDKSWTKVGETKSLKYTDENVKNGKTYMYSVRAYGEKDYSARSSSVKAIALSKPTGLKAVNTTGGVKISWNKMTTATGYKVYRKAKGETEWTRIATIRGNASVTYTDKKAVSGKTYSYTVRQFNGDVSGSRDVTGVTLKYISAPSVTVTHSPKGVVIKWSKSPKGTAYEIQRKVSGEKSWKTIKTIKSLSTVKYTDKNPVYGKKNYYRINVKGVGVTTVSFHTYLWGINPNKKMVALTYDDGPNTSTTNRILDVLEKNNSRATFFVVGSRVDTYSACIKREAQLDCEIGNHTYNHTTLTKVSTKKITSEIDKTNSVIKKYTGKEPVLVRTPGGAVNSTVKNTVEYPIIGWSVDTLDWKYRKSSSVVSSIKNNVKDGSIVLMHDLYESTASATEEIVPWLIKKGYQIVTVSEMMAVKGNDMKDGTVYSKA